MEFSFALGFATMMAIRLAPAFFVSYAAPNKAWLVIALVIIAPFFLYKGIIATSEPCGMVPQISSGWLLDFLTIVVGAGLRGFTTLIGGRFNLLLFRLAIAAPVLFILGFYSYRLVNSLADLVGLETCMGA